MKTEDVPEQLIYAYAGEPEITATEAHFIAAGLARVLTIVEREPEPHAFKDYNDHGNDCHVRNCRLSYDEHL